MCKTKDPKVYIRNNRNTILLNLVSVFRTWFGLFPVYSEGTKLASRGAQTLHSHSGTEKHTIQSTAVMTIAFQPIIWKLIITIFDRFQKIIDTVEGAGNSHVYYFVVNDSLHVYESIIL